MLHLKIVVIYNFDYKENPMLIRKPVAAGRFYPGDATALRSEVRHWLDKGADNDQNGKDNCPWAVMLPHAGYIYCGNVLGQTLASQKLPSRLIILCPNHTGYGQPLGLWPEGAWVTPLGEVKVDENLAADIIGTGSGFAPDTLSHLGEHSIEVILPFLQESVPDLSIVPICVGTQNSAILRQAASGLANVLQMPQNANVGLIVSSDMNHYENERATLAKDELALAQIRAKNPDGLLQVVGREKISMCGAGPMALALYTAKDLGNVEVEQVAHETSGKASGDYGHTVGYAGLRLKRCA